MQKVNVEIGFVSVNDREIYVSVGYGLEGALPDSKTGRIIDIYGLEYLKNNDFSSGIEYIFDILLQHFYLIVCSLYHYKLMTYYTGNI